MLTLYHFWSSTCSRKVRICLAEKGLEWESHHVDIVNKRTNTEPWYVALNPNGVVPTLDHDGRIVTESNIIIEYLDDRFPEVPLRPEDDYLKAVMRLWMDKAETIIHKNINIISWNKRHMPRMSHHSLEEHQRILSEFPNPDKRRTMLKRLADGVSADEEAFAEESMAAFMDSMDSTLADRPWLTGETFSLADIAIAPFVERFGANGLDDLVDFDKRRHVGDWWARLQDRASYKTAYSFENPDA